MLSKPTTGGSRINQPTNLSYNAFALPPSEAFPYLGQIFSYNSSDWPVVYHNMKKARKRSGMIARVLEKIRETVWARVMVYKAVA